MNKILLSLLLLLPGNYAMAEWVRIVSTTHVGPTAAYIDPDTAIRNGFKVSIWILLDFTWPQTYGRLKFSSMKSRQEYDCQNKKMRILDISYHTGNMAKGNMIFHSSTAMNSEPVTTGNRIEDLWEQVCAMRIHRSYHD